MVTERERFWAAFALFLAKVMGGERVTPKAVRDSIFWVSKFTEIYSEEE